MHARGTKRSAEADELELRSELAPGSNGRIATHERSGMLDTATEIIHSSLDMMVGIFAHTRIKLRSLFERSTPNTDGGSVSVKRVKLSDDGHKDSEDFGSVRWKSESVNGNANWRSQERRWLTTDSNHPHKPSIADGQMPPFPHTEASTVGSFTSPGFLAGSYPVEGDLDNASMRMSATVSTNSEKGLENSLVSSHIKQPFAARNPTLIANYADPRSKTQLYGTKMRSKGAVKSHLSLGSLAKSRPSNGGTSTQLPSNDSEPPVFKDEAGGEEEPSQAPATLTVFDNSKGILDAAEAFGELKISGDVAQREEERERKAREREEELERKRVEQERQREDEKRRVEEELEKQAEEQRLREEAERRGGLRQPSKDLFPVLSAEWTARVQQSLIPGNGDLPETLETKLKTHDFERLIPSTVWLNDNIVNGTLLWLDRSINEAAGITDVKAQTRKCLMPGSFFFTRLLDHGVKGTERTLRRLGINKDNILDIETILMPICQVNHWTLVVVEPQKRRISHFDSLNPAGSDGKRALAKDWMKTILGDSFVEEEWRFAKYRAPRQTNGWDCGVHTVLNGVCLGLGIEPSAAYSSDQLPDLRKRIAAILLNQGFKGDFSLEGC